MNDLVKLGLVFATQFIAAWVPCAMVGRPWVGLAAGVMSVVGQQVAVYTLFSDDEEMGE